MAKMSKSEFLTKLSQVDEHGNAEFIAKKKKALKAILDVVFHPTVMIVNDPADPNQEYYNALAKILRDYNPGVFPLSLDMAFDVTSHDVANEVRIAFAVEMTSKYLKLITASTPSMVTDEILASLTVTLNETLRTEEQRVREAVHEFETAEAALRDLHKAQEMSNDNLLLQQRQLEELLAKAGLAADALSTVASTAKTGVRERLTTQAERTARAVEAARSKIALDEKTFSEKRVVLIEQERLVKKLRETTRKIDSEGKIKQNLLRDNLLATIERIKKEKAEVEQNKVQLEVALSANPIRLPSIKTAIERYESSLNKLNQSIQDYNAVPNNTYPIVLPKLTPFRRISTAKVNIANLSVQLGTDSQGLTHQLLREDASVSEVTPKVTSQHTAVRSHKKGRAGILRAAVAEKELVIATLVEPKGEIVTDTGKIMLSQNASGKVTDLSENLSRPQKQKAAIAMAKMYALNYSGKGAIEITGEDKVMASMIHAALLKLLPDVVDIHNFVIDAEYPQYRVTSFKTSTNDAFVKKHLKGNEVQLTEIAQEVKLARAAAEKRLKAQEEVNKNYSNRLVGNTPKAEALYKVASKEGDNALRYG